MSVNLVEGTVLGALAAARVPVQTAELQTMLEGAEIESDGTAQAVRSLAERGLVHGKSSEYSLTQDGIVALLDYHAEIQAALDPSPDSPLLEECPSVRWLTTVRACWREALSINYSVDPDVLAKLLPDPLEPELHKGQAWVQVLISSLEDMRPQGAPALFGVCFCQVSYRAAVIYRSKDGQQRRGGFFVRSDTNHEVMRTVGNTLTEFKFHRFGSADMVLARQGDQLIVGVDPEPQFSGGKIVGVMDTRPLEKPPPQSVWGSLEELHEPLIECYDALGVDHDKGYVYILTIDRDPWDAHFAQPEELYCEYFDQGPLGAGASRLDSVLHMSRCRYSWRPLRREAI